MAPRAEFAKVYLSWPVMKSQTPMQALANGWWDSGGAGHLVTTTAIPAVVEMLQDIHEKVSYQKCLNDQPDRVNGEAVLVNVARLLKDMVQVPDLYAAVDR